MAKNMQPIVKRCRTLGISPAVMGYTGNSKRESNRNPGPPVSYTHQTLPTILLV